MSPALMGADDLVPLVQRTLTESCIEPSALRLEITERTLLEDHRTVESNIRELHRLGVAIVIDDFGTGYSSLAYLSRIDIR
jgi:EAL domain-containing protein (putative c-di-GMP-specific phosphodiesterase class I)